MAGPQRLLLAPPVGGVGVRTVGFGGAGGARGFGGPAFCAWTLGASGVRNGGFVGPGLLAWALDGSGVHTGGFGGPAFRSWTWAGPGMAAGCSVRTLPAG